MNIDETNLTAYALGELSGTERTAVASHLVGNADARKYVAGVRATANVLADELARESFGGLTELQHAAIEQKLEDAMRMPIVRARRAREARWNRTVFAMSMAASILIVCGTVSVLIPFIYRHAEMSLKGTTSSQDRSIAQLEIGDNPGGEKSVVPGTTSDTPDGLPYFLATPDEPTEEIDQQWVPQPDNRLLAGSGREETPLPETRVGVFPSENVKPTPMVQTVRGPETPGNDPKVESRPAKTGELPHKHGSASDNFANLPVDQRSPDKTPTHVESSLDGMLPAGDQYAHLLENPFIDTAVEPVSGFSAGVDTASYSNIRRFLTHGKLPPHDAVRIEEMLNYFPVRQAMPPGDGPLVLQVETGACPWRPELRLARVCLQARDLPPFARPPVNLVLLIDVSASMRKEKSKLPMLKHALHLLAGRLASHDRISIIAYTQEPGIVLPPTSPDDKQTIRDAIDRLDGGGQIIGGKGIEVAYEMATNNFIVGGVNRIVLATDGNWNIGVTNRDQLAAIAHDQAAKHISLTVLGVGMDNLKDATLQNLAAAGNGSYAYIDTLAEAKKVLIDQVDGALVSKARDVKVQVTFNHAAVSSYRLIGYERRGLSKDELNSNAKPGGELGAGQSVTALYEVIPAGKYSATHPGDMMTAAVTYTDPLTRASNSLTAVGQDRATPVPLTSVEFRFAAAVAEFGLLLRDSDYKGNATYSSVLYHLRDAKEPDETGYRQEFLKLAQKAKTLADGK